MKISTQIAVLSLGVLMLLRTLVIPVLWMDYQLRKDYIAKYLCVNRDKPQLHCDGKCYLAKRIAAAQEQEQRQAEQDFFQKLLNVVSLGHATLSLNFEPMVADLSVQHHFFYSDSFSNVRLSDIFHPPLSVA